MMQTFDLRCEALPQDDGTYTFTLEITGLSIEQAADIAEALRSPVRATVLAALTEPGAKVIYADTSSETKQ